MTGVALTEGAAFVLCAVHGATGEHLEVEAMPAVQARDDAFQLRLWRRERERDGGRERGREGERERDREREG